MHLNFVLFSWILRLSFHASVSGYTNCCHTDHAKNSIPCAKLYAQETLWLYQASQSGAWNWYQCHELGIKDQNCHCWTKKNNNQKKALTCFVGHFPKMVSCLSMKLTCPRQLGKYWFSKHGLLTSTTLKILKPNSKKPDENNFQTWTNQPGKKCVVNTEIKCWLAWQQNTDFLLH